MNLDSIIIFCFHQKKNKIIAWMNDDDDDYCLYDGNFNTNSKRERERDRDWKKELIKPPFAKMMNVKIVKPNCCLHWNEWKKKLSEKMEIIIIIIIIIINWRMMTTIIIINFCQLVISIPNKKKLHVWKNIHSRFFLQTNVQTPPPSS